MFTLLVEVTKLMPAMSSMGICDALHSITLRAAAAAWYSHCFSPCAAYARLMNALCKPLVFIGTDLNFQKPSGPQFSCCRKETLITAHAAQLAMC